MKCNVEDENNERTVDRELNYEKKIVDQILSFFIGLRMLTACTCVENLISLYKCNPLTSAEVT
jgi:hypothetical protein